MPLASPTTEGQISWPVDKFPEQIKRAPTLTVTFCVFQTALSCEDTICSGGLSFSVSGLPGYDRNVQMPMFSNIHIHTPTLFAGRGGMLATLGFSGATHLFYMSQVSGFYWKRLGKGGWN